MRPEKDSQLISRSSKLTHNFQSKGKISTKILILLQMNNPFKKRKSTRVSKAIKLMKGLEKLFIN